MVANSSFPAAADVRRPSAKLSTKARKRRRQMAIESLESRVVLSYTFSYAGNVATALGSGGAVDSLVLEPLGGFLLHSVNGSAFDGNWGGSAVPVSPLLNVNVTLSTGDGSSVQLGTATGPASTFGSATLSVVAPVNTTDKTIIDDSHGTTLASGAHPYSINTQPGFISGPGFNYSQSGSQTFTGGVTLLGSPVNGDIYNVLSVCCGVAPGGEPMTIETASGTTSTVNVSPSQIYSPLAIYDPGDSTTININDAADTTHSTATLDNLSGNPSAPYEVTGLSGAPVEYGAGVTALNINGGTFGGSGVTYNINNTQAGTTTTINGGPNQNFINLSDPATADLDNVAGPVVVHGGTSFADVVTLNDTNTPFSDSYTLDDLSSAPGAPYEVTRAFFGGLSYDDNIGTLTLNAENTTNLITIDDTAPFVIYNINGQGGGDTIDVFDTGFFGVLNVDSGFDDGSIVNVVADNEPVNITGGALATVNIGSTGGAGSMAGIQGPISVANPPSLTDLNFHDENDTTGQTWTLDNDDGLATGTVAVTGSATTSYNPFDLSSLTVNGGSGGNTFDVNNTSDFYPTILNTGTGDDTVNVYATGANTLDIHGQSGQDTVTLGANGDCAGHAGTLWHHQRRQRPRLHRPGPRRFARHGGPERVPLQRRHQRPGHRPCARHDQLRQRRHQQPDGVWRQRRQYLHGRWHDHQQLPHAGQHVPLHRLRRRLYGRLGDGRRRPALHLRPGGPGFCLDQLLRQRGRYPGPGLCR